MTRYSSRDRAEEAVKLRAREYTWQEIADRLGFSSRGAARLAADRQLQRTAPEAAPDRSRRYLLESARRTSRRWHDTFEDAYERGDIEAMAQAHRGLCRDRDQVAKLTGSYAPERAEVSHDVRLDVAAIRSQALALAEANTARPAAIPSTIDAEVTDP